MTAIIKPSEEISTFFDKEQVMVVMIHGSLGSIFGGHLYKAFVKLKLSHDYELKPNGKHPLKKYKSIKDRLRAHHGFNQPISELGLLPIKLDNSTGDRSEVIPAQIPVAQSFELMHSLLPDQPQKQFHFYTFGWTGALKNGARFLAANLLYDALIAEQEQLQNKTGKPVKIILCAHSHGGNVALNLARIQKIKPDKLKIWQLINMGTPVQSETSSLIYSDLFERIYNIYSPSDLIQVADTFSTKDFFSARTFTETKEKPLPSNLTQIQIKVDKTSPRHAEFCFVGISPLYYRSELSIFPFPILSYLPLILDAAAKSNNHKHITVTLKNEGDEYVVAVNDFLTKAALCNVHYPHTQNFTAFLTKETAHFAPHCQALNNRIKKYLMATGVVGAASVVASYLKTRK